MEHLIAAARPDILIEVLPQTVDALNEQAMFTSYHLYQLDPGGPRERRTFVAGQNRDYALVPNAAALNETRFASADAASARQTRMS